MKPQTIQIFLPDGSPKSIRETEITNRTNGLTKWKNKAGKTMDELKRK